jgi:hypothetical protein
MATVVQRRHVILLGRIDPSKSDVLAIDDDGIAVDNLGGADDIGLRRDGGR